MQMAIKLAIINILGNNCDKGPDKQKGGYDLSERCAVILAAGDGTRMRSKAPKVLCRVLFRPMLGWVLDNCTGAGIGQTCVVVGAGGEEVRRMLPEGCHTALQAERLGTGHAVMCARDFIRQHSEKDVLILYGDAPFIAPDIIDTAYRQHTAAGNDVTVITAEVGDPTGYGRIIRQGEALLSIVEHRDADDAQKAIKEINSGAYWFKAAALLEALDRIGCSNSQGEYYLPDAVAAVRQAGGKAAACLCADEQSVQGANDRKGLALLNDIARRRVLEALMEQGVDIPFDDGVVIDARAVIGTDTTVLPGSMIIGNTVIGSGCTIGPGAVIEDSTLGDSCVIKDTYITGSVLEEEVKIGPYSQVRPGSHLAKGVKIGNFVEIKNANLGEGTKSAHLTYIGDADIGARVNFGCGVVVVNYDGYAKHRTVVGDDAFIGCNTNLVAPIKVGNRAYTAAGSTVAIDVPDDALVIARARETVKEGRVPELKEKLRKKKEEQR